MTRDEAIEVSNRSQRALNAGFYNSAQAAFLIDTLAALGLLKLDEPKSIERKTHEMLTGAGWDPASVPELERLLHVNGLKIVEVA